MKNFLYKFEFTSGFYENYFYQQVQANDEKSAIIEVVSYFKNIETKDAEIFIQECLWSGDEEYDENDNEIGIRRNLNWSIKVLPFP